MSKAKEKKQDRKAVKAPARSKAKVASRAKVAAKKSLAAKKTPPKEAPREPKAPIASAPVVFGAGKNVVKWHAPDYYTFEKSPYWSLGIGLIAIIASLILYYSGNYFPIIIIILAVIVTFQLAHQKPSTQEFALDEGGALARNSYIPYREIKSFWVARHGRKSILYFQSVSSFRAPIVVPLGRQSAEEVRVFLLKYLVERLEAGELMSEKLIRIFRL